MGNWFITSWGLRELRPEGGGAETAGAIAPTAILDFRSVPIVELVAEARAAGDPDRREILLHAHRIIRSRVTPVYSIDDSRPASTTLLRGTGSCSQRLAILESVARSVGVPTRSRGLLIRGRFWFPRFWMLRPAIPDRILLAWPEFQLDGEWLGASEIFGAIGCHADSGSTGFSNSGSETLFEAIGRSAIDWDGATSVDGERSCFDLSEHVIADLGRFPSRDALFSNYGQTLCPPSRMVIEPILGRMAA